MKSSTFGVELLCVDPPRCLAERPPIALPAGTCGEDIARIESNVFSAGWLLAELPGSTLEFTDSSFLDMSAGFAMSSAKSVGTRKIATAIVAIMCAPNFIVAS